MDQGGSTARAVASLRRAQKKSLSGVERRRRSRHRRRRPIPRGGAEEAGSPLATTAGEQEGSGAGDDPGGAAAGGGATTDATSEGVAAAGVGVRHGSGRGERSRVACRRENPDGDPSGVGNREGGHEASGVAENPGGDRQGVGWVVESPQGINTPGVEELPREDETFGVPTKGEVVPGEGGGGRGGDGNLPTTRATEASGASGVNKGMMHGLGTTVPSIPHRGKAADGDSAGTLHRHSVSADGARPENGMQLRCEYGLLAPEEPAGDPDVAGTQVRRDGHRATRGTDDPGQRATDMGDGTGQSILLTHGMPEDDDG